MNSDAVKYPIDEASLKEWIRPITDPDIGVSLVDLGLIYDIKVTPAEEGKFTVDVNMTLTTPMCPSAGMLQSQVTSKLQEHELISTANVKLVFEPKWDPATMASDEVKDRLGIW